MTGEETKRQNRLSQDEAPDDNRTEGRSLRRSSDASLAASQPEVVVITGASAGVGRATVRAFARRGAHVGLLARGHDGLEGARREVEELGGRALVPTDWRTPNRSNEQPRRSSASSVP